ncbi:4-hydroxybenzoate 3-monooxygenase [Nocardia brasiliensis]|uniref:4-hydroxybenzoate 3-monooxygenase n=1 Tax=Nocardia brasiliensis TaxID=37326 RepID=UPI00245671ED|nr:4-hydroxybenzoate 3-monooxygenase [Nocardia brasiliensis]
MSTTAEHPAVVVIGAGVAGLTLGNFLLRNGIGCVILEQESREHVEQRQRAGALDGRGVRMLREWGLGEVVDGFSTRTADTAYMPLLIEGETRLWNATGDDTEGIFCTQQALVQNLIRVFLRDGGDLRFEARDITLDDLQDRPTVRYQNAAGNPRVIGSALVAGCDGDRGVSRSSIPAGVLTRYAHEHGYAWLAVLADVPADPPAVMAVHSRGFAGQITRGPQASRFYLQCPLTDTLDEWPEERIWSELGARFGYPVGPGRITDSQLVPLRSVVYSPMRHGNLYLLGDAAHLVSPMSAKGMSMALHDAEVFARAAIHQVTQGDSSLLDAYSDTCLRHIWDVQTAAVQLTEIMHNGGDATYEGEFRKQLALAELRRMSEAPAAEPLSV